MRTKVFLSIIRNTPSSVGHHPFSFRNIIKSEYAFLSQEIHTTKFVQVENSIKTTDQQQQNPMVDQKDNTDTISKAMSSYLQRAQEHQEFMDKQEKEFVFGRRHLANMMGKDPENFSQSDINEAIRYLFPSGLYEPKARPMMKPPQEIYPKQKSAQFDMSGRPHHPFFYTALPNFFYLLHEMVGKLNKLNAGVAAITSNLSAEEDSVLAGSVWISKENLEEKFLERLSDRQYSEWVSCMERIANHPKRDKELEFIKSYRKPLAKQATEEDFPPVTLEPDGRRSCFVPLCMRKSARGEVKVTVPGTGIFNINGGQGLDYFKLTQSKEIVLTPLQLTGLLGKVDVDAYVTGGTDETEALRLAKRCPGETAQAGCIRWGISTAVAALGVDQEKLRLAGLLVRDHRQKERSKVAHTGARAAWTWKKR